jgi:hypothetical protein
MGSPPTLVHHELAAEALELDPEDWQPGHVTAHLAAKHPQVDAWPDDNPCQAHDQDHRDGINDHPHRSRQQAAEQAFDRLNPTFGVPADHTDPPGQQAVRDREAALALGPRVAVASSRENDRDPVIWLGGQDYRAADAIHHARTQPTHLRRPVERVGAER